MTNQDAFNTINEYLDLYTNKNRFHLRESFWLTKGAF
jgi:hypothetical protein